MLPEAAGEGASHRTTVAVVRTSGSAGIGLVAGLGPGRREAVVASSRQATEGIAAWGHLVSPF